MRQQIILKQNIDLSLKIKYQFNHYFLYIVFICEYSVLKVYYHASPSLHQHSF